MKLSCKDLDSTTDCDFVAYGGTSDEVATKMMSHLKSEHSDKVKEMKMSDDEIMSMLESKAHN